MNKPKQMPSYWTLAEEVTHLNGRLDQLMGRLDQLMAENAKLRKLVAEMYAAVECCCGECWLDYGHNPAKCENENCGYRKEYVTMRMLGIEVNE